MAVTVTTVLAGTSRFICDIAATADGDVTTGNIAHGLGATPLSKYLTMLQVFLITAAPHWALTTLDATNAVCEKAATVGSGVAGDQVRMEVSLPHSLVR